MKMEAKTVTKPLNVLKVVRCPKCRTKEKHKVCIEKMARKLIATGLNTPAIDEIFKYDEFLDAS
ncbi:MAG: hypothetical protein JW772_05010, partial [Candidatus Diapherotrites archaeon]|nr:hypothetical protein [Candidatus Diapherotrites archaeon]